MSHTENQQRELLKLWEEMGASTGAMLGRFIGLGAILGLSMINSYIINPLKNTQQVMKENRTEMVNFKATSDGSVPVSGNTGVRTSVWGEMVGEYGEAAGETIGLSMDILISGIENYILKPMENALKNMEEQAK